MAATFLLFLLLISSAYSTNVECPGGWRRTSYPESCNLKEAYEIGNFCCPRMISEKLKNGGIIWPVTGMEFDEAKKTCSTDAECNGGFCDNSTSMGTWKGIKGKLRNCYKSFKCHGILPNSNIILCKTSNNCPGGFCDTEMSEFVPEIKWNGDGICCQMPKCPLANQLADKSCNWDEECDSLGLKWCLNIVGGQYCCPIDKKYLCPDGSRPSKVKNKLSHQKGMLFECMKNTESRIDISGGEQMCCPRIVSQDYYFVRIDMEPLNPGQTCASNSKCNPNEFCGVSTLVKSIQPLPISHCYPKPSCIGTSAVTHPSKGLKYCSDNEKCGTNEACDISALQIHGKGICCSFECDTGPLEAKSGIKGTSREICTGCENEKDQWSYCGYELVNNPQQLDVCKKVGSGYRQCTYQREPAKCPQGYHSPLRKEPSHELMECNTDSDCWFQGERSQCVKINSSTKKICCRGDFCPDIWLWRKNEKPCVQDKDCHMEDSKGFCDKTTREGNQDPNGHCCPQAEVIDQMIQVDGPYRSNKDCTKLEDCFGQNRFCDPYNKKCMYHRKSLVLGELQPGKTCDKDKMNCGENRIVCMAEGLSKSPQCYRHPRDPCDTNEQCQQAGKYCAPKDKTAKDSLLDCYLIPTDAVMDSTEVGLTLCSGNTSCGLNNECHLDNTLAGVKKGYCRKKVHRQCRGHPRLVYYKGFILPCSENSDCQNNEFCDLVVKPALSTGNGFCCSLPAGGDGEPVRNFDVGLKTCAKDDQCDQKSGEICSTKFTKDADSLWKPEDGVCFKVNWCPVSNLPLKEQPACSTAKDCKVSTGEAANCEQSHCCPKNTNGQISHPFVTKTTCQSVEQCTEKRMFCDPEKKRCTYFGADNDFVTTEKCPKNKAGCKIKDVAGVCVYANEDRTKDPQCWVNPLLGRKSATGTQEDDIIKTLPAIIFVIVIHTLMIAAAIGAIIIIFKISRKKKAKLAKLKEQKKKEQQKKEEEKQEKEIKDAAGVCVYADDDRTKDPQCWVNPLLGRKSATDIEASDKKGVPSTSIIVIIVVVVVLILLIAAGVVGFFLYKKIDKKKKAKLAKIKAEKEAKEKAEKEKQGKKKAEKQRQAKEEAEKVRAEEIEKEKEIIKEIRKRQKIFRSEKERQKTETPEQRKEKKEKLIHFQTEVLGMSSEEKFAAPVVVL